MPGHKCSGQLFSLEIYADGSNSEVCELEELLEEPIVHNFKETMVETRVISLHALIGENVLILPLGGCEMVSGVQWLSILGDIRWNFKDLVMDLIYNNRRMVLRGTSAAFTVGLASYEAGFLITAMERWPTPVNVKQLRGFLGLTGYYRRFIKNYAIINKPLTTLLKKNSFTWNPSAQLAFETLKSAMSQALVLALPGFNKPFTVETDASGIGIGVVLQQGGHPIAYLSKSLSPKHQALSTYENS
nr:retrotransposon-related protein [Tanacetum cinerariifolium]